MENFTDDEKVALGAFCELMLQSEQFKLITQHYESATVQRLLSTSPKDRNTREDAYHEIRGVQDFLRLMAQFASEKNRLLMTEPPQPSKDEVDPLDPTQDAD